MFRNEANRLCRFFELSSLTLALAPRGGFQGKAGFLRILGSNASKRANQPGLMPTSWKHAREPKWWIVRESYFVATSGPESVSSTMSQRMLRDADPSVLVDGLL
jgi:phospholipase D1/2